MARASRVICAGWFGLRDRSARCLGGRAVVHLNCFSRSIRFDKNSCVFWRRERAILRKPIRFSGSYSWLRNLFPPHDDISDYEHPLIEVEFASVCTPFQARGLRYLRLLCPLAAARGARRWEWKADRAIMSRRSPRLSRDATSVVVSLRKPD